MFALYFKATNKMKKDAKSLIYIGYIDVKISR